MEEEDLMREQGEENIFSWHGGGGGGRCVYDSGVVSGFTYLTAFQELTELPGNRSWGEVELPLWYRDIASWGERCSEASLPPEAWPTSPA